jgi:signal transduction histidine kinase
LRRPLISSSAARLATLYVCSIVVGVGLLLWSVYALTERSIKNEVDLVIEDELDSLWDEYDDGGAARLTEVVNRRKEDWGRTGAIYLLVDGQGNRLAGNLSAWPSAARADGDWLNFFVTAHEGDDVVDHPVRAKILVLGTHRLLVGSDVSERQPLLPRLRQAALWGTGLTALLTAVIGWYFSRRVGSRVRGVAEACENIISGDLAQRLPRDYSQDEFDQLAVAVNHMLDRIEQQTAAVRTTFDSAAHDLRAPLHRIRTRLESALHAERIETGARRSITDSVEDVERLQRMLGTLLQIAQTESGHLSGTGESVDLARLSTEIGDLYAPEARERSLQLTVDVPDEPVIVHGNRQLLAQLLTNLLENAFKYVPAGGRINVKVGTEAERAALIVRDNGPGIPPASREPVLLPFRRLDRDAGKPGSGLGLSLVAAVTRLHHGTVALEDNNPGLVVRCEFPRPAGTAGNKAA